MMEADPSLVERVVPAMHKFVSLANAMLKNGTGVEEWTATRWADMEMTLQWWVTTHPQNGHLVVETTICNLGCTTSIPMAPNQCCWKLCSWLKTQATHGLLYSNLR